MKKLVEKNKPIKIVAIGGPTASGKTAASLVMAKEFNGAIISCDSRQIYREMDIATDKIPYTLPCQDPFLYENIEHYGINIANINHVFSLSDWLKYAHKIIKKISNDGKVPFLVGGTGLYIQALIDNYDLDNDFDPKLREELNKLSLEELQDKLKKLDPEVYEKIDVNNSRRVVRAIEKLRVKSQRSKMQVKSQKYENIVVAFNTDREEIRKKIEDRVEEHLKNGVIEEVRQLVKKYGIDNQVLNSTIGIQEYIPYVLGKTDLEEAKKQLVLNSYHYAKRQMTWFRKYGNTVFCDDIEQMRRQIKDFLGYN